MQKIQEDDDIDSQATITDNEYDLPDEDLEEKKNVLSTDQNEIEIKKHLSLSQKYLRLSNLHKKVATQIITKKNITKEANYIDPIYSSILKKPLEFTKCAGCKVKYSNQIDTTTKKRYCAICARKLIIESGITNGHFNKIIVRRSLARCQIQNCQEIAVYSNKYKTRSKRCVNHKDDVYRYDTRLKICMQCNRRCHVYEGTCASCTHKK